MVGGGYVGRGDGALGCGRSRTAVVARRCGRLTVEVWLAGSVAGRDGAVGEQRCTRPGADGAVAGLDGSVGGHSSRRVSFRLWLAPVSAEACQLTRRGGEGSRGGERQPQSSSPAAESAHPKPHPATRSRAVAISGVALPTSGSSTPQTHRIWWVNPPGGRFPPRNPVREPPIWWVNPPGGGWAAGSAGSRGVTHELVGSGPACEYRTHKRMGEPIRLPWDGQGCGGPRRQWRLGRVLGCSVAYPSCRWGVVPPGNDG